MKRFIFAAMLLAFILYPLPVYASGIIIGSGGTIKLNGQSILMNCNDLTVEDGGSLYMAGGLVHQIVPPEKLMDEAVSFSQKLSELPFVAVGCVVRVISVGIYEGIEQGITVQSEVSRIAGSSKDAAEGFTAFLEKRKPVFKGK